MIPFAHAADWLPFVVPAAVMVGWLVYTSLRHRRFGAPDAERPRERSLSDADSSDY